MEALANCYVCLDGGGSKIECSVVDDKGNRMQLRQDGVHGWSYSIKVEGANVNYEGGGEKLTNQLRVLFDSVKIEATGLPLRDYLPFVKVIAGMAGAARPDPREKVTKIFEATGVQRQNLTLQGDAEMWLSGAKKPNAVVVICGTGHVIFGKINGQIKNENGNFFRLGGWGPDDRKEIASGYNIALEGLAAVRGSLYEGADQTALSGALKAYFGDTPVEEIPKKFQVAQIAKFAKEVFDSVHTYGDSVAREIIFRCFTSEIPKRIQTFIQRHFKDDDCNEEIEIKYVGGLMKGGFYERMESQVAVLLSKGITQENASSKNVAEEFFKTQIMQKK